MAKIKTEFELVDLFGETSAEVSIVKPFDNNRKVYLRITSRRKTVLMNEDLERFAVNILKALKSKHLK